MPRGITQCYLPPGEVTFPPLPQPKLVLDKRPRRMTQMASYITRWYTRQKTVTRPGTNRARRALTSFMRRTPLTTTPRRQPTGLQLAIHGISQVQCERLQKLLLTKWAKKSEEVIFVDCCLSSVQPTSRGGKMQWLWDVSYALIVAWLASIHVHHHADIPLM